MSPQYHLGFDPLGEEVPQRSLPVTGDVPDWLVGTLYRNGPAQFLIGDHAYRHWFDGLAMLHAFVFEGESDDVTYTNRFLRSRTFTESLETGRVEYGEFGTTPNRSVIERLTDVFDTAGYSHNNNVNVIRLAGRLFAATETVCRAGRVPARRAAAGAPSPREAVHRGVPLASRAGYPVHTGPSLGSLSSSPHRTEVKQPRTRGLCFP